MKTCSELADFVSLVYFLGDLATASSMSLTSEHLQAYATTPTCPQLVRYSFGSPLALGERQQTFLNKL